MLSKHDFEFARFFFRKKSLKNAILAYGVPYGTLHFLLFFEFFFCVKNNYYFCNTTIYGVRNFRRK